MIKRTLLAAVLAASALASTPAIARPMTATDMHMMHRLGSPEVAPDGRYAVFSVSTTDLQANKRNNPLFLLDLTRRGATRVHRLAWTIADLDEVDAPGFAQLEAALRLRTGEPLLDASLRRAAG